MKKILMIGGTGTISMAITKALAQDESIELYVLNRGKNNRPLAAAVHQLVADIHDAPQVTHVLADLHFDCVCDFITYTPDQAQQAIRQFAGRTAQYIFVSTVATYDRSRGYNFAETTRQGNVYSAYGQAKQACEAIFLDAYQVQQFPVCIVRPSQTYNDDRLPLSIKGKTIDGVISRMRRSLPVIIHGDGTSLWTMTHSDDFRDAFIALLGRSETLGQCYQIMGDDVRCWNEIYAILGAKLGVELHSVHLTSELLAKSKVYDFYGSILGDKQYSSVFDTRKIHQLAPQWQPAIHIEEGIDRYLRAHPNAIPEADFDDWCALVLADPSRLARGEA